MTRRQRFEGGPTLCLKHAYQTRRLVVEGDCDPVSWLGGHGQVVTCDVVADPGLVQSYLDKFRAVPDGETP